jgi:hypothetical protein
VQIPDALRAYECGDYFDSPLAETGWREPFGCWFVEPADRLVVNERRGFLVIGRPCVDGIEWGYRRGLRGIWAYFPFDDEFRWLAESLAAFRDGWASGAITV